MISSCHARDGHLRGLWAWGVAAHSLSIATTARADYSATDLYTLNQPAGVYSFQFSSQPQAAAGGQVVGFTSTDLNKQPFQHALLWTGQTSSDLTPNGFDTAYAYGTDGLYQVGEGSGADTGNNPHALLWKGSSGTAIDLHPANFRGSSAYGIGGGQQVGYGYGPASAGSVHALLWKSTADSVIDLHPTQLVGFSSSVAYGTDGAHQVGGGMAAGLVQHALLWSGTPESAIDLHPTNLDGFSNSIAVGVAGNQQVGYGWGAGTAGNLDHALVWSGTPNSAVDLNPSGFTQSEALATNGALQAGYGSIAGNSHALLWSGTAASAIDLNALLPAGFISSQADSFDSAGDVFGIATDSAGSFHAIEWKTGQTQRLPVDVNGDGSVGFDDLIVLARNYGKTNATWADGDFDGDGKVGFDDLIILARHYGQHAQSTQLTDVELAVPFEIAPALAELPEPSQTLLGLSGLALLITVRRRSLASQGPMV